jgi:phage shock protein A
MKATVAEDSEILPVQSNRRSRKEQMVAITKRVLNIFRADIHSIMDRLEDRGLLLKQYLRDMQAALGLKKAELDRMFMMRKQVQQKHSKTRQQSETLERELAAALKIGQDDIVRMLIRKIKPLNDLSDQLAAHLGALDEEILHFKDHLERQRLEYEQLKLKSAQFFQQGRVREWQCDLALNVSGPKYERRSEEESKRKL